GIGHGGCGVSILGLEIGADIRRKRCRVMHHLLPIFRAEPRVIVHAPDTVMLVEVRASFSLRGNGEGLRRGFGHGAHRLRLCLAFNRPRTASQPSASGLGLSLAQVCPREPLRYRLGSDILFDEAPNLPDGSARFITLVPST